jgi:hypothetical protein
MSLDCDEDSYLIDTFTGPRLHVEDNGERAARLVAEGESLPVPRRPLNHAGARRRSGLAGAGEVLAPPSAAQSPHGQTPEQERQHDASLMVLAVLGASTTGAFIAGVIWTCLGWEPVAGMALIGAAFWTPFVVAARRGWR